MDTQTTLDAFVSFLPTIAYQTPAGDTLAGHVYAVVQPDPSSVDDPILVARPGLQNEVPNAGILSGITTGTIKLWFFMHEQGNFTGAGIIVGEVMKLMKALTSALKTETGKTLNGAVAWCGDGGSGITVDYDDIQQELDLQGAQMIGLVIEIAVQEHEILS